MMLGRINTTRRSWLRAAVQAFKDLPDEEVGKLEAKLELLSIPRGQLLIRQGGRAEALYLVVSGRFQVYREGRAEALAEIGSGQPIGEIAFFSGGTRTASVQAERDSLVLKLEREDFEHLAERSPTIWRTVTAALARRLADATAGKPPGKYAQPRTIAICRAGAQPIPEEFIPNLRAAFEARSRCIFLDSQALKTTFPPGFALESGEATSWFNDVETRYDYVFYVADAELTSWSEKAIRQADLVLNVGVHKAARDATPEINAIERFAHGLHRSQSLRLVLLHDDRSAIAGTRRWLDGRPLVRMHYHLVLRNMSDYQRLARYISGTALGLVACGGGAFSAAHVGLYQALCETGLVFDMMGGTSGGGAIMAAIAAGADIEEIDRRIHEIFVERKALRRWTWPRYSLVDHTVFDRALAEHYANLEIEDLWTPYFAVSTNLSTKEIHCHRRGPLWQAVRSTTSIPALLPPFYTDDGEMLVDGSLLDNVPTQAMRSFKTGPNVVISFQAPKLERFDVDYRALPSRGQLIWRMLNPLSRTALPAAPGPISVLMRSLMVGRKDFASAMEDGDLLLVPPLRRDMGVMDWQHHARLRREAYRFALTELDRLKDMHPLLKGRHCSAEANPKSATC